MLTVEDYARIRRVYRDGMSIRAIARRFGHSRRKIREVLKEPEPRGYTRTGPPLAPKLGPFMGRIDEILEADRDTCKRSRVGAALDEDVDALCACHRSFVIDQREGVEFTLGGVGGLEGSPYDVDGSPPTASYL